MTNSVSLAVIFFRTNILDQLKMSIWLKENRPGKVPRLLVELLKGLLMEIHHQTGMMSLAQPQVRKNNPGGWLIWKTSLELLKFKSQIGKIVVVKRSTLNKHIFLYDKSKMY